MISRWLFLHRRTLDLKPFLQSLVTSDTNSPTQVLGLVWESLAHERTILGIPRASQNRQLYHQTLVAQLAEAYDSEGLPLLMVNQHETDLASLLDRLGITHLVFQPLGGWEEAQEEKDLGLLALELNIKLVTLPWNTLIQPTELPFSLPGYPEQSLMPRTFTPFRKLLEQKPYSEYLFSHWIWEKPNKQQYTPVPIPNQILQSDLVARAKLPRNQKPDLNLQFLGALEAPSGYDRMNHWFDRTNAPSTYKDTRNGMGLGDYSSKLSPWLAQGKLQAWEVGKKTLLYEQAKGANESTYWIIFELLWRDFFRFLGKEIGPQMYRPKGFKNRPSPGLQNSVRWWYPAQYLAQYPTQDPSKVSGIQPIDSNKILQPLQDPEIQGLWQGFLRWTQGRTGQPLVDAAMKELVFRGTMSNRLRQCVASWLIYDLALPWWWGALWFEHWLLDYDPDSNWGNWAYLAGVGADPQESRRFNLEKQQQTYDPKGTYIRWVSEQPWTMDEDSYFAHLGLAKTIPWNLVPEVIL